MASHGSERFADGAGLPLIVHGGRLRHLSGDARYPREGAAPRAIRQARFHARTTHSL